MEYLEKDLEHDELFYKNALSTFVVHVTSLSDSIYINKIYLQTVE